MRDALVVGINQYPFLEDARTGQAKHLRTPASDAEAIAQLLEADNNFRVRRLPCSEIDGKLQVNPDKPLKADELEDEITKLFLPKDDRDTALLFFAGHGLPKPLGDLKQILLSTSDVNPRLKKWKGLLLRDLWDIVEQSSVKEQIIWLDSCHSGQLLEFKDSDLRGRVPGRKRFLIAASHSSEVAYERLDGKQGVLSGALIEGLNPDRMPQNQGINDRKLADFVEEKLKAYYLEAKLPQQPQIRRPDGEIQLVRGKSSANAAESTQPKTSIVRKIPFVLPQLDVSSFTGREEELQQLEELLLNRQGTKICSIASLAGVGGIGKSALACHFATIHKDDFPDGVIGLRVDGKDLDAIAREFARQCGEEIDSEDERDASTIMQEVFAYRRMLLIFDNAEESSIQALRPGGDRCAVIVTTRDRGLSISLDIPNEGRINLPPLPAPESLRLLETLIGKERVAIEPEAACNLIELTGKLPLALQIIGAGLKLNEGRKLTDYVASLRDERKRLERMEVEGDKHLDLRACFSLSLKQLQPDKINFFACLSLCASDGFSRRTATATSGFNDEYDAQKYLDYLCRISLLNYAEVGENRFVFHSLIRLFARELLVERGLEEEATARHAEFCINLVKSFNPNNSDIGVSIIGEEIDDIILAAEWLQKNGIADSDLAESLNDFFEDYGYWSKATHLMRGFQALAESREDWEAVVTFRTRQAKYFAKQNELPNAEAVLAPLPDIISRIENPNNRQRSEIKWLIRLGRIRQQQQLFDAAVNALQRGVTIAEELGEQDSLRKILDSLANVFKQQRKWDEAIDAFQRVVEIEQALNNRRSVAIGLNGLAGIFQQQGKLDEAAATFQRRVEISEAFNDQRSVAIGLNGLAGVLQQQGKLDEAAATFQRRVEISEAFNDQRSVAIGLNGLAGVLQQQGKLDEAAATFQRVVEISEALNDRRSVAIGLNGLAGVLQQQGKLDEAAATFQRVVEISEALNDRRQIAIGLNGLAGVLQQQGKLDEAVATFQRRVEISEALNDQRSVAIGLNGLAGIFQQQGKLDQAVATFQQVVEISETLNDRRQIAIGLNGLAGVLQQQGKLDQAAATFQRSVVIEEKFANQRRLTMTLTSLSKVLRELGRLEEAIKILESIAVIEKELGDQQGEVMTLVSLSSVLRELGRFEEAIKTLESIAVIDEQLDNPQQSVTKVITQIRLGAVFQQQGDFNKAIEAFERSLELSKEIGDQKLQMQAMRDLGGLLHHQGGLLLKRKESWNEAEKVLRRSQDIFEELDDFRNLAMVLNSLGGLLRKQEKWKEAETMLRGGYNLAAEKLKDKRGQAIILNSLGQVLSQQQDPENFKLAIMYFRESITLGEELDDQPHLAKVYTAMGQALLKNRETEQAVIPLIQGFEIDEKSRNSFGLALVTQDLTCALGKLGRQNEALAYCQRALAIDPTNRKLQELCDRLSSPHSIKKGTVKYIRYNTQQRCYWGHITPNDRTADIYFREGFSDSHCIAQLKPGAIVEVEVEQTAKGPCANNIRAC
jgi:tetratricopeptide (TPR) repeat protein